MPTNIEIKARIRDFADLKRRARSHQRLAR